MGRRCAVAVQLDRFIVFASRSGVKDPHALCWVYQDVEQLSATPAPLCTCAVLLWNCAAKSSTPVCHQTILAVHKGSVWVVMNRTGQVFSPMFSYDFTASCAGTSGRTIGNLLGEKRMGFPGEDGKKKIYRLSWGPRNLGT